MNSILLSSDFHAPASLPPFGRYTIEPGLGSAARVPRTPRRDEGREQRIQRHLAWCELLQRERLATAADFGTPPRLREPLHFVAPARDGHAAPQRRTRRHESVFFATVLASLFFTFASSSLSAPEATPSAGVGSVR